jgi:hypothetical protein
VRRGGLSLVAIFGIGALTDTFSSCAISMAPTCGVPHSGVLTFLAAIQHLPPRQRAAVILHDVLGWPARQTAQVLDGSVASVNSALQRERATLREHLPPGRAVRASGSGVEGRSAGLVHQWP